MTDQPRKPKPTKEQRQEWGRKGGKATFDKYGADYMATIGAAGYQATVKRFGGDGPRAQGWIHKASGMPRLTRATDGMTREKRKMEGDIF